jgi:hypothetical protein
LARGTAPLKDGEVQLGDIAGKITILKIACCHCERRGRLRVAKLIEQRAVSFNAVSLRYPSLDTISPQGEAEDNIITEKESRVKADTVLPKRR